MRVLIGDQPTTRAMKGRRVDDGEDTQEMRVFIGDIIGHINKRPAKDGVLRRDKERDASFQEAKELTKTHTGTIAKTHNGKDHASGHGAPSEGRDEEEQERQKDDNGEDTQVMRVAIGDLPSAQAKKVPREVHHNANDEARTNTGNNKAETGSGELIHNDLTKEEGEGGEQDTGAGGGGGGGDRGEGILGRCN